MSDDSLSSPATIKVRVVNKNAKISVDDSVALENMLSVHNLLASSHPYLLNKIGVLEQIAQNLNLKDQEIASSFENAMAFHNQLSTAHPSILSKITLLNQDIDALKAKDNNLETYVNQSLVVKANTNLSNISASSAQSLNSVGIRTVVETYQNGVSGYRVWSNGFIEQWGRYTGSFFDTNVSVALLRNFSNINYNAYAIAYVSGITTAYGVNLQIMNTSNVSTLYVQNDGNNQNMIGFMWKASGY